MPYCEPTAYYMYKYHIKHFYMHVIEEMSKYSTVSTPV